MMKPITRLWGEGHYSAAHRAQDAGNHGSSLDRRHQLWKEDCRGGLGTRSRPTPTFREKPPWEPVMLELRKVTVHYGTAQAIKEIDITIHVFSVVSVIGANLGWKEHYPAGRYRVSCPVVG